MVIRRTHFYSGITADFIDAVEFFTKHETLDALAPGRRVGLTVRLPSHLRWKRCLRVARGKEGFDFSFTHASGFQRSAMDAYWGS